MINDGDVVFFKSVKTRPHSKGMGLTFKGHGIGILLGHQQKHLPDPTMNDIHQMIGGIGLVGFDDIAAAVGPEIMKDVMAFVEKKYK